MGRLSDLRKMLSEGRLGFKMDEVMSGYHEFEPGMGPPGRHPFEFRVTWGPKSLVRWINPVSSDFMTQPLEGTVTAGALCFRAPCKGILELLYFTEGKIRYTFDFTVGATEYEFVGEKVHIRPWNLPVSHTTCFGIVKEKDTGKLLSRSVTFFKLWRTPSFLASARLA
ncbi:MAG: hypothetical protein JRI97_01085 [Deltaproteobacteria bacterium]|nr:hypothetical protein [Deltaproteobacteria bacterium]